MKHITKSAARRALAQALKRLEDAQRAIYGYAPNDTTRFSDCMALASDADRKHHASMSDAVAGWESLAIDRCFAYRSSLNLLLWY